MSNVLYAGPWAGEFGWELCSWNPLVRKLGRRYERVVVEGPASSSYLYEDFADEYIENDPVAETSDCYNGESKHTSHADSRWHVLDPRVVWAQGGSKELNLLRNRRARKFTRRVAPHREWRSFAQPRARARGLDVLCAFRPKKSTRGHPALTVKEYPRERCRELVAVLLDCGLRVGCFGGQENYHFPNTEDLRGQPLHSLCKAISRARCVVGPSSGTIHLASLCETPHVTWYGARWNSHGRYKRQWNPFGTPMTFIKNIRPAPQEISREVLAIMRPILRASSP